MRKITYARLACAAIALFFTESVANAHGFVGDRFFPPTITTDDPFATDELLLPSFTLFYNPADDDNPSTREIDHGFEFDKEILPHFSLGISDNFITQKAQGTPISSGWDDLAITAKYELCRNDVHEAIISIGMETDLGGTGSKALSDSFTTFVPTFYFGKGFGDLPDYASALRPFAITGTLGQTLPTNGSVPNALEWGIALEYSIPYLQQNVMDVGLPAPFKNMIPLVEFSFETPENRGVGGQTTGTINPGALWETPDFQLGVEALIPINHQTGDHIGVVIQLQIFIDDLFPKIFGHPIFGDQP